MTVGNHRELEDAAMNRENPRSEIDSMTESGSASVTTRSERAPSDEQIRMRAYELYLARGDEPADEMGDWLRAEGECRGRMRGKAIGAEGILGPLERSP
jgi:hypothetical protein